jgi:hypothetical protein
MSGPDDPGELRWFGEFTMTPDNAMRVGLYRQLEEWNEHGRWLGKQIEYTNKERARLLKLLRELES